MEHILVTGIDGFVGSHLAEYFLSKENVEIYGTIRNRFQNLDNIEHIKDKLKLIECDLTDYHAVTEAINRSAPDRVFHLAAQSFVPTSWKSPIETFNSNIMGTLHLFEAVRKSRYDPKIVLACSSEEYGKVFPNEIPIKETNPLRPRSPYAVSKIACDFLAYQYFQSYGLKAIRTRFFNITGPRRGEVFVCSNFAKQIAMIEAGKQDPVVYVGNLSAKRDFTDVRDVVRAYDLASKKCRPGIVYNVCSGKAHSIKEVLDILKGFSKVDFKIEKDKSRLRPSDVPILIGDSSRFRKATGWEPKIPFKKTLEDLLNYWREKLENL